MLQKLQSGAVQFLTAVFLGLSLLAMPATAAPPSETPVPAPALRGLWVPRWGCYQSLQEMTDVFRLLGAVFAAN